MTAMTKECPIVDWQEGASQEKFNGIPLGAVKDRADGGSWPKW